MKKIATLTEYELHAGEYPALKRFLARKNFFVDEYHHAFGVSYDPPIYDIAENPQRTEPESPPGPYCGMFKGHLDSIEGLEVRKGTRLNAAVQEYLAAHCSPSSGIAQLCKRLLGITG